MSLDPQPTYTTAQVHLRLGVPKPTLRNWSGEYAAFLSDRARPNGGSSRRFTPDDLVVLSYRLPLQDLSRRDLSQPFQQAEKVCDMESRDTLVWSQ